MANGNAVQVNTTVSNASVLPAKSDAIPAEALKMIDRAFRLQREYDKIDEFTDAFVETAVLMATKYYANSAIAEWERALAKCQKLHQEFNRDMAVEFLRKTRSGKELEKLAGEAAIVKVELS